MGSGRLRRKSQPRITTYCKRRNRFEVSTTLDSCSETLVERSLIWEPGSTTLPGLIQTAITHEGYLRAPWRMDLWTSGAPRSCWMVKGMFFPIGTCLCLIVPREAFLSRTSKHSGPIKALQFNPSRHGILATAGAKGEVRNYGHVWLWVLTPFAAFHIRPQ